MLKDKTHLWKQSKLPEHSSLIPRNVLVVKAVASDVDDRGEGYLERLSRGRYAWRAIRQYHQFVRHAATPGLPAKRQEKQNRLQPVHRPVMGELDNKLVDDAIHAHRPADKLQGSVVRVAVDEMVAVEGCQAIAADASG